IGGHVLRNITAIAAANFSLALQSNGTLVAWGENRVPKELGNVVAIAAREFNALALKKDGTVVAWRSFPWQLMQVPTDLTNVVGVAVGGGGNYVHNMALQRNGTVVAWGSESAHIPAPPGLSNVVAIAAGYNHSLALKRDGTVFGWGYNRA